MNRQTCPKHGSSNSTDWYAWMGYPLISRLLAGVMLLAAVFKANAWFTSSQGVSEAVGYFPLVVAGGEAGIAVWVLIGASPRWSRCVLLLVFVGFFNVAAFRALQGHDGCGCFGNLALSTWLVICFDLLAIAALILSPRVQTLTARPTGTCMTLAVSGVAGFFMAFIGAIMGSILSPTRTAPSGSGSEALAPFGAAINANYEQLSSIDCQIEIVAESSSVKEDKTVVTFLPEGGKSVVQFSPRFTYVAEYSIAGKRLRRVCRPNGEDTLGLADVIIVNGEKVLQHAPQNRRAWIGSQLPPLADHPDPRCLGFPLSARDVPGWLVAQNLKQIQRLSQPEGDVLLELTDDNGQDIRVTLSAERNYLPTEVCFYNPDGSLSSSAQLIHERAPDCDAWFLKQAQIRRYRPGQCYVPHAGDWVLQSTHTVKDSPRINQGLAPDCFDPVLPAGTVVSDAPSGRNLRLKEDETAFSSRAKPRADEDRGFSPIWLVLGFANCLILGLCVVFRGRILAH